MNIDELQLQLNSPVGGKPVIYRWPLIVGVGDERDECSEIIETIRWVFADNAELKRSHKKLDFLTSYDPKNYQSIKNICERYNKALEESMIVNKKPLNGHLPIASPDLLKHIMQVAYNRSIEDPDKLNQYEPFSPEVYGETSFELIRELTQVIHVSADDTFIDLGSGVGQVVLQIAASTRCKYSYGIEKAHWPAKYSKGLAKEFGRWMSFFGKHVSPFELEKGDFLGDDKVDVINSASIIFVNNFAFGPNVDHQLKLRFANVKEGARIISSKAFCSLNFHITERNLSDIGTIMKVEELTALPSAVSWTDKPFSYYLHTIDRSLLESYFKSIKSGGGRRFSASSRVCKKTTQLKNRSLRKNNNIQKKHSEEEEEEEEEDEEEDEASVSVKKKIAPKPKRKLTRRLATPLVRRGLYGRHGNFKYNNTQPPREHHRLPSHIRQELNNYLERMEEGMLQLMTHMHTQQYKQHLSHMIHLQKKRHEELMRREGVLKGEVVGALSQGVALMQPYFKQNGNDLVEQVWRCLERRKELMTQHQQLTKQLHQLSHQSMGTQQQQHNKEHSLTLQELLSLNEEVKYNTQAVNDIPHKSEMNCVVSEGVRRSEKRGRGVTKQGDEGASKVKRGHNSNMATNKKFKRHDSSISEAGLPPPSNSLALPPISSTYNNNKLLHSTASSRLITTSSMHKSKTSACKSTFQVTSSPSPFQPFFFNKTTSMGAPSNIFKSSTPFSSSPFPFYKASTSLSLSSTFFSQAPSAIPSKPLFTDLTSCNPPPPTTPHSKCIVMFSSPLLSPPLLSSVLSTISSPTFPTTPSLTSSTTPSLTVSTNPSFTSTAPHIQPSPFSDTTPHNHLMTNTPKATTPHTTQPLDQTSREVKGTKTDISTTSEGVPATNSATVCVVSSSIEAANTSTSLPAV